MLVWEILLGTERAQKGARRPRSVPQPETPAGKGVFSGSEGGGKILSGLFPSEEKGWNMRGLKIEEGSLTAVREGG